jgi:hypothetical protein
MMRLTRDNQGYFDRLQRARSWIAKAQAVAGNPEGWDDLHAQFIFYWIALNALYGRGRAEQVSDIKDLDWFIHLVCDFDSSTGTIRAALERVSRHARRLLNEKFLFEAYWDMGTTRKVERMLQAESSSAVEALNNGDFVPYLKLLLRRLRVARNQIFHGSSTDRGEKSRMSVRPAVSVLEVVVPTLADVVEIHGKDRSWPSIPYPRAGSPLNPDAR